jgi:hypothetical protein
MWDTFLPRDGVVFAISAGARRQPGFSSPQSRRSRSERQRYAVSSVCRPRDRDSLFPGWARSEFVALEVADLAFEPEGVVLRIQRSKTDREGAGATVAVPLGGEEGSCPIGALRR